jgi:2-hydroxychromene-2-carboxylate isomerase
MSQPIEVFFSFRSPYSYLATPDMLRLELDFDAEVILRPVLPLAIRRADFFNPENLKRAKYIRIDWLRRAEFLGMEGVWPDPDPIVQDMETFHIAEDGEMAQWGYFMISVNL